MVTLPPFRRRYRVRLEDILFFLAWAFIALMILGLILIALHDYHAYKV
jgi:hypothetical protein